VAVNSAKPLHRIVEDIHASAAHDRDTNRRLQNLHKPFTKRVLPVEALLNRHITGFNAPDQIATDRCKLVVANLVGSRPHSEQIAMANRKFRAASVLRLGTDFITFD
jgi:hypothetical protein